jgi:glycosyltransferase involved in cell wall biosynthesis
MSERLRIITFTNLYPSAALPHHGTFVQERMQRVVAEQPDLELVVVNPLATVPRLLARGDYARTASTPEQETVSGVAVHHPRYFHLPGLSLGKQALRMARAALPVVEGLARGRRCVLDAHYVYPDGVAAVRVGTELALPCVVTARGSDVNVLAEHRVVAPQLRAAMHRARALLAVSDALRRRFAQVAGVGEDRVELVRNGVDLALFRPGDARAARAQLGLPVHGQFVLGVGRLVPAKGFDLLVRALAHLPAGVAVVLVGEGPQRKELQRLAPAQRLFVLGARSRAEVACAMRAADVFALPSAREGWPNVVTEALASGLPVVATAVGGIPEIIGDPVAGELVADDVAADVRAGVETLAAAIARQLARPRQRAAIASYAQRFAWDTPIARLRTVLRAAAS